MNNAQEGWPGWPEGPPNLAKLLLHRDAFGPRPEDLRPFLDRARQQFGADSEEYAQELMDLGDAERVQCRNAEGMAAYQEALAIFQRSNPASYQTARALDACAIARESAQDYPGAEADLSQALALWETLDAQNAPPSPWPPEFRRYVTRRREDWDGLRQMIAYQSRPGPTL